MWNVKGSEVKSACTSDTIWETRVSALQNAREKTWGTFFSKFVGRLCHTTSFAIKISIIFQTFWRRCARRDNEEKWIDSWSKQKLVLAEEWIPIWDSNEQIDWRCTYTFRATLKITNRIGKTTPMSLHILDSTEDSVRTSIRTCSWMKMLTSRHNWATFCNKELLLFKLIHKSAYLQRKTKGTYVIFKMNKKK